MFGSWLLPVTIVIPLIGAIVLCARPFRGNLRLVRVVTCAFVALTALAVLGVAVSGDQGIAIFELLPKVPLYFRADGPALLFAVLTVAMWLCSTLFACEYMRHETRERRYCCFSLLALGALMGVSFSGNCVTTYLFYEMMTLASFPLVMHEQTKEAVSAGMTYLYYSLAGAFLGLVGIFFMYSYAADRTADGGILAYVPGGFLRADLSGAQKSGLLVVVFLMLVGFGSKVGMYPLHGWLPKAHPVAPSPASALLSGNITKMGILFVFRTVYYMVGPEFLRGTWVQNALLGLSLFTVFLGSMMAFREKVFKKRLAYSTVSQTSYILTGRYLLAPAAAVGALLHVVFHSVVKNLLFLCAGAVIYRTGRRKVAELKGIGHKMPVTMTCFTVGGLALVGIPPLAGFVSKWYLASGALDSKLAGWMYAVPVVLLISALLTAGYLLTVSADAFFTPEAEKHAKPDVATAAEEETAAEPDAAATVQEPKTEEISEVGWRMRIPLIVLACASIVFGIFPGFLTEFFEKIVSAVL